MRRFTSPAQMVLFLGYFFLISLPKELLQHLLRFEFKHIGQTLRGIAWNFSHPNIQVSNENINL
jgi:hypothetical protein